MGEPQEEKACDDLARGGHVLVLPVVPVRPLRHRGVVLGASTWSREGGLELLMVQLVPLLILLRLGQIVWPIHAVEGAFLCLIELADAPLWLVVGRGAWDVLVERPSVRRRVTLWKARRSDRVPLAVRGPGH